jgi:hypothetical protein
MQRGPMDIVGSHRRRKLLTLLRPLCDAPSRVGDRHRAADVFVARQLIDAELRHVRPGDRVGGVVSLKDLYVPGGGVVVEHSRFLIDGAIRSTGRAPPLFCQRPRF